MDDTLRGQIRRIVFKQYKKADSLSESIVNLAVIHSSKITLFAIFIVSVTYGTNIINAVLFTLFLILTTISYEHAQNIWKLSIFVTGLIITTQFSLQLFKPDFFNDLGLFILKVIGLSASIEGY
jgi:hypothetical protein